MHKTDRLLTESHIRPQRPSESLSHLMIFNSATPVRFAAGHGHQCCRTLQLHLSPSLPLSPVLCMLLKCSIGSVLEITSCRGQRQAARSPTTQHPARVLSYVSDLRTHQTCSNPSSAFGKKKSEFYEPRIELVGPT